jgi:hypothetical protein
MIANIAKGFEPKTNSVTRSKCRLTEIPSEVPGVQVGSYVEGHGKELFPSGEGERDGGDCG